MATASTNAGFMDIVMAVLLGIGCIISLPIYWWLLVTPLIHLLKRTRKQPARQVISLRE